EGQYSGAMLSRRMCKEEEQGKTPRKHGSRQSRCVFGMLSRCSCTAFIACKFPAKAWHPDVSAAQLIHFLSRFKVRIALSSSSLLVKDVGRSLAPGWAKQMRQVSP